VDLTENIPAHPVASLGARLRLSLGRRRLRQLTSESTRLRLAGNLERVVEAAEVPQALRGAAAPVNRDQIRQCRPLLLGLASELASEDPVTPLGVRMLNELRRDGGSALYAGAPDGALELALRHARAALLLQV
jgi:hypothetical protein